MHPFYRKFFDAYRNEKNTRRLLPFQTEILDKLKQEIDEQAEYIKQIKDAKQYKVIYEQELENIKYFYIDYIKTRLIKIQKDFYLDEYLMSKNEAVFYNKFLDYFKSSDMYVEEGESQPNFECVGFIAKEDIGNVMIENNSIDISIGDFFVVKYVEIEDLLLQGKIVLV
ncbi:hypothetical protein M153_3100028061 [Pseudoloma neurophilia]|uniref:DNA replication complex GINS protein SLD5 n=1 Tax=Pseudoloma neurophilia TaxID=146866 RepID=A0A0R0M0N7_9MICR|nr:hypothetical protein M153_3100028061 [Pseudoloma neurophilia]